MNELGPIGAIEHRGLREDQPYPNSFLDTHDRGGWVEVDVALTSSPDGESSAVIIHENDTPLTLSQIESLGQVRFNDLAHPVRARVSGQRDKIEADENRRPPFLNELLYRAQDIDAGLLLELKADTKAGIEPLVTTVVDEIRRLYESRVLTEEFIATRLAGYSMSVEALTLFQEKLADAELPSLPTMLFWISSEEFASDQEVTAGAPELAQAEGYQVNEEISWLMAGARVARTRGFSGISFHNASLRGDLAHTKVLADYATENKMQLNASADTPLNSVKDLREAGVTSWMSERLK